MELRLIVGQTYHQRAGQRRPVPGIVVFLIWLSHWCRWEGGKEQIANLPSPPGTERYLTLMTVSGTYCLIRHLILSDDITFSFSLDIPFDNMYSQLRSVF